MAEQGAESEYSITRSVQNRQLVGHIGKDTLDLLGIRLPAGGVYLYPGTIKHIIRRHGEVFWKQFYKEIPDIIAYPDYVGQNPREADSVEFIRDTTYLMVAVKWDNDRCYFFVSSFYQLDNGEYKITKRLSASRIIAPPDTEQRSASSEESE